MMISAHNIGYLCRWTRISIPLPNAALTETTRFRWKQSGSGAGSMWAVDNGESYDALSVLETFFFSLVLLRRRSNTPVKLHERTEEGVGGWFFRKRGKLNFSILMPPTPPPRPPRSVHGSRLPPFLLGERTLFPHGLQVRIQPFIKPNKFNVSLSGRMSRLIIILMPRSTNHHSKLIKLYYGHHLLMDFHYLCLLFLLLRPSLSFFFTLCLSSFLPSLPPSLLPAGVTQASAVRPASWPPRPSQRSSPRVSPALASPPTTASPPSAAPRSASAAACWPAARRWSSTGIAGGTWSRRRWTVHRPGDQNKI